MRKLLYAATVAGACLFLASTAQAQCACGSGYYGYGPAAYYGNAVLPQSPLTMAMRPSPRTTGMRPQFLPTNILCTRAMAAITEAVGTDMGRQQSACGVDFMVTAPELVWAASAMDIAQSA